MSNFNLYKTIVSLCLTADTIDEYGNKLALKKDEIEGKIVDLYHIIELYELTDAQIKKLYQELKKVLRARRKVKNDIYLFEIFNRNKSKMPSELSRKFLLQAVGDATKRQDDATYNFRTYTHDELNKILGAKILPVEQQKAEQ